jgi:hypothetical protein
MQAITSRAQCMAHELVGARFGSLVVTRVNSGAKNVHNTADCRCDCGNNCRHRLTRLRTGLAIRCHRCGAKSSWEKRKRQDLANMAASRAFNAYVDGARRRGIAFSLTKQQCLELFVMPCDYCGALPSTIKKARNRSDGVALNGIDRVDSSAGYNHENCVPCCSACNFAKRNMTREDFIALALRITRHQSK